MMAEEGPRAPWPGKGDEPLSWGKGFIKEGAEGGKLAEAVTESAHNHRRKKAITTQFRG